MKNKDRWIYRERNSKIIIVNTVVAEQRFIEHTKRNMK